MINNVKYSPVLPFAPTLSELAATTALVPFAPVTSEFIAAFSDCLARRPEARTFPELMALSFWMRKSHLQKWREVHVPSDRFFQARGTVFHIAPSNVDTIFVYSWFLSLICGNRNIVRVPSQDRSATGVVIDVVAQILQRPEFSEILSRTLLVRYPRDPKVNEIFSSVCDLRVIWGGDETVRTVRNAPLPPTAIEMTFSDKFSFSVLNAEHLLEIGAAKLTALAEAFYNDSVWFGQMACSSPRLIVWHAENARTVVDVRTRWWTALTEVANQKKLRWDAADSMNKRCFADELGMNADRHISVSFDQYFTRIWLERPELLSETHCGAGLFYEFEIRELSQLVPLVSRKVQTITYCGITRSEWQTLIRSHAWAGVDRIVPVGQALQFHPVWDGYDLSRMLLREVQIG